LSTGISEDKLPRQSQEPVNSRTIRASSTTQLTGHSQRGFDVEVIDTWIGLKSVNEALYSMSENLISQDLETCPRSHDLHYQVPGANIKTVSAMYVTH